MTPDRASLVRQNQELLAERDQLRVINAALRAKIDERAVALRTEATESQRLRDALDHVPSYIYMKDTESRFVYANQATLTLFGCTHEALVGRRVTDFFPLESAVAMESVDAQVLAGASTTQEVVVGSGPARRVYLEEKTPLYTDAGRGEIWGLCGISTDISERKRAEDALRESEFFFRESQRTGRIGSYRVDFALGVWKSSEVLDEILGIAAGDEHTLESWGQLIHPDDRERMTRYLQDEVMAGGRAFDNEYRIVRRSDGAVRWVHGTGALEWGAGRAVVAMAGTILDVTETRAAEEALRESEERFRTIFNEAPLGVVLSDAITGTIYEANERFAEIVGRPKEALIGTNWMAITHPDDVQENVRGTASLADGTIPRLQLRKRYRRPDGTDVWVGITVAPFLDKERVRRTNLAMVEDISAHMGAEEELRKLSRAVEQSSASIVITNVRAEIEYVNESFIRKSGYSRDELMGRNPRILHSGETSRDTYDALWRALTAGETWTGEFYNRRKDGSTYIELAVVSPLRQPDGTITHYVSVKEDITERKRIDQELARHRDHLMELVDERTRELVEARELAEAASMAKSAFLATMSHEIRTPLNGVIAMAEILALRQLAPRDLDAARTIQRSANNLLSVIDDILDFSKIEAGKLELEVADVSLRDLADDVSSALSPVASGSDVELSVAVSPAVPAFVRGDATRVRQVLMNLTGNAIKFSRDRPGVRGKVSVRVEVGSASPLCVAFRIADNGIGMSEQTIGRLFSSFTQAETSTTRRFGGTGLGLAISKRLVELMQGTITVTSVEGLGSTFTVILPMQASTSAPGEVPAPARRRDGTQAARPVANAMPQSVAEARAHGRLILVAEDDSMNQKVVLQQLSLLGYAGEIAGDGVEALRLWRQGTYAMLLTDLHMPHMDGYELVTAIRREEPAGVHLPILALTANALRGEAERAANVGMDGYLTKPVPLVALRAALEQWVAPTPQLAPPIPPEPAPEPAPAAARADDHAEDRADHAALVPLLERRVGETAEAVRKRVATYLRGVRPVVGRLQSARASGNLRKVSEHAARLKATSRALGAERFGDLCAELENVARMGDEPAIDQLLPTLVQSFSRLETELELMLKAPGKPARP
ncbi:MAG: PAS domain S-box protein [Gemmatimonadaceae bacterium]